MRWRGWGRSEETKRRGDDPRLFVWKKLGYFRENKRINFEKKEFDF